MHNLREEAGLQIVDLPTGIVKIVLDRPDRLNSFTAEMLDALNAELDAVADDEKVRAVLLTGSGRGFCAGQDLHDRSTTAGTDLGASLQQRYNPLIVKLAQMPKPVVCAVNGVAAGAGCSVALACDLVLAAESASFVLAFARIGLVPDSGATWHLPRLVGKARASAMALLAEPVTAEQAEQWGLIWQCVPDEQLAAAAEQLCARLAAGPTGAYRRIKQLLAQSAGNDLVAQLAAERDMQREAGSSADYAEGVAAFLAKRPPKFAGS